MLILLLFFFNATPTTDIYTLSLHDALPIFDRENAKTCINFLGQPMGRALHVKLKATFEGWKESGNDIALVEEVIVRSEEHTSELQSRQYLVCRLLLEKKKKKKK